MSNMMVSSCTRRASTNRTTDREGGENMKYKGTRNEDRSKGKEGRGKRGREKREVRRKEPMQIGTISKVNRAFQLLWVNYVDHSQDVRVVVLQQLGRRGRREGEN